MKGPDAKVPPRVYRTAWMSPDPAHTRRNSEPVNAARGEAPGPRVTSPPTASPAASKIWADGLYEFSQTTTKPPAPSTETLGLSWLCDVYEFTRNSGPFSVPSLEYRRAQMP